MFCAEARTQITESAGVSFGELARRFVRNHYKDKFNLKIEKVFKRTKGERPKYEVEASNIELDFSKW